MFSHLFLQEWKEQKEKVQITWRSANATAKQ